MVSRNCVRVVSLALIPSGSSRCGGKQTFDSDAFERVVVALFEDAGTHRAGAENRGMDDALKHGGTVAAFSDSLDHVVHELDDDLLLLLQELLLFFDHFDVSYACQCRATTCPIVRLKLQEKTTSEFSFFASQD